LYEALPAPRIQLLSANNQDNPKVRPSCESPWFQAIMVPVGRAGSVQFCQCGIAGNPAWSA
jgi:hypothetical protein